MIRLLDFIKIYKFKLIIIFILLVGAFLRIWRIDEYMTFLGDEGRDVLVVKRMIVDHKITLLGPTASVGGFFMGPVYYYFMAPFLWLWKLNPVGPAVMVALFGVATIYLVYIFTAEVATITAGIFASSLFALSPLVIAYSRSSWNPNIVPFFATLLVYLLYLIHTRYKSIYLFVVGVILGIGIQLHYVFLFLYAVCAFWLIYTYLVKRSFRLREFSYILAGVVVGDLPFLLFELRHGFPNTRSIYQFLTSGKDTGLSLQIFITNITDVVYRLFGRLLFRLPDRGLFEQLSNQQQLMYSLSVWTIILITALFICIKLVRLVSIIKSQRSFLHNTQMVREYNLGHFLVLTVLWLLIPLAMFGFYKRGIYDYYLGILYALPFIFTGILLSRLAAVKYGLFLAMILWSILMYFNWEGRPFKYEPNRQLAQMENIARVVFEKTDGKPFNFALVADQNSDHAYRYFFEIWGNPPVTIEYPGADPNRRSVTDQLLVICENPSCQPLGHPLWEIAGFGRAEITGLWEVPFVKIYKLMHYRGDL